MAAGYRSAVETARGGTVSPDERARCTGVAAQISRAFDAAVSRPARLIAALLELEPLGWTLLTQRRWPERAAGSVDAILVGPGGVVVIDVVPWRGVTRHAETVWEGETEVTEHVATTGDLVYSLQEQLAEIGLPATSVHGLLVGSDTRDVDHLLFGVRILGGDALALRTIARLPRALRADEVARVRTELEARFPPPTTGPIAVVSPQADTRDVSSSAPGADSPSSPGQQLEQRLPPNQVLEDLLVGVSSPPAAPRVGLLEPPQARAIRRSFAGPSRIRGATGTGKTLVTLHRAAYLARTTGQRVLVTTYVKTLPQVLAAQFRALAPDVAERVEFHSVHSFAYRLLVERGQRPRLDGKLARDAFHEAWAEVGASGALARADANPVYWRDEIVYVIKGRGLRAWEQYAALARTGRRRALGVDLRREVWQLALAYEAALQRHGIADFEDLVLDAEQSLRTTPSAAFGAVLIDEAQDLSCAMVRMLHALVGDRPDGLHLVGDGQQTLYPGGYTLAEAGVSTAGRGVVLTSNHRNSSEILAAAHELIDGDEYLDIDGALTTSPLELPELARRGPAPVLRVFPSRADHDVSFIGHIRGLLGSETGLRASDIAVLSLTRWSSREAVVALEAAGIRTQDLQETDARTDAVHVGTIKRAKGLEFAEVVVVQAPGELLDQPADSDSDDGIAETREFQRRELYVAMTRARHGLWVGVA